MAHLVTHTDKLAEERQKRGYSMQDMSYYLNLKSKASYFQIEKGKSKPNIEQALQISLIFKKPVTYFFEIKV